MPKMQPYAPAVEVRLVPVIEMMPVTYARVERSVPFDRVSDAYFRYWTTCLADSGIARLRPIKLWHVPLEQLTSVQTVEKIIQTIRFEEDPAKPGSSFDRFSDPEEYLSAFAGGYALYVDDHLICTPRCCGDLTHLQNWRMAAGHRDAEQAMVWIGHPWITVRYDGAYLVFKDQVEGQGRTEWDGEIRVLPTALQQAVAQAKQEVLDFCHRLLPIVETIAPSEQVVRIAETLTGIVAVQ